MQANCRHEFRDSKHCVLCGVSVERLKAQQRDDLLRFELQAQSDAARARTTRSEADQRAHSQLLAVLGSDVADVLTACEAMIGAVVGGATLVLAGPDASGRTFGATLESSSGARCANAYGPSLRTVVVELMGEWQRQLPHAAPSGHVESTPQRVHWVKSFPESKAAELRGFRCGAPFDHLNASSYQEQVTCAACLEKA